jgi:hypothetical protein
VLLLVLLYHLGHVSCQDILLVVAVHVHQDSGNEGRHEENLTLTTSKKAKKRKKYRKCKEEIEQSSAAVFQIMTM